MGLFARWPEAYGLSQVQFLYFASVREAIGQDRETFDLPAEVSTVAQCLDWLSGQSDAHEAAFADRAKLRFARDQTMVRQGDDITSASELAIFPPVTGG